MDFYFAQTNGIISSGSMSATPAFGFEVDYIKSVYLRGGVGNFQNLESIGDQQINIGFQPDFGIKAYKLTTPLPILETKALPYIPMIFSLKLDQSIFR
jgi:hypothetical protein